MSTFIERIRTRIEKHLECRQMAFELSELDPRELEAILHIAPREIDQYCRSVTYGSRGRPTTASKGHDMPRNPTEPVTQRSSRLLVAR